jgi:uncharacterized membrane protein
MCNTVSTTPVFCLFFAQNTLVGCLLCLTYELKFLGIWVGKKNKDLGGTRRLS